MKLHNQKEIYLYALYLGFGLTCAVSAALRYGRQIRIHYLVLAFFNSAFGISAAASYQYNQTC